MINRKHSSGQDSNTVYIGYPTDSSLSWDGKSKETLGN